MAHRRSEAGANSEYDWDIMDFPKAGRNATFEPTGGMVSDPSRKEDRVGFFDRFTKDGDPVYLIGAANNAGGDFNETARRAYVALKMMEGRNALLGQWTDPDGSRFMDAVTVSGIYTRQALVFKCTFGQQEILEVTRHGVRPV